MKKTVGSIGIFAGLLAFISHFDARLLPNIWEVFAAKVFFHTAADSIEEVGSQVDKEVGVRPITTPKLDRMVDVPATSHLLSDRARQVDEIESYLKQAGDSSKN